MGQYRLISKYQHQSLLSKTKMSTATRKQTHPLQETYIPMFQRKKTNWVQVWLSQTSVMFQLAAENCSLLFRKAGEEGRGGGGLNMMSWQHWLKSAAPMLRQGWVIHFFVQWLICFIWGRYHVGRRPSSDDSFHNPTAIPTSALDKPSIMKRYHRRRTCSHTSPRRSPTMVTLNDIRFVECRWWNDGWTVKTVVTWRPSASMIPAPGVWEVSAQKGIQVCCLFLSV